VEPTGEASSLPQVDPLLDEVRLREPEIEWSFARLMHAGDANAHVEIAGFPRGTVAMRTTKRYRAADGSLAHEVDWVDTGGFQRAFGMVQPLHYADFGGGLVKLLYVGLGLGGTLLIASGLLIWLEGKRRRAPAGARSHRVQVGITAGVLGGLPLSLMALPAIDRLGANGFEHRFEIVAGAFVILLGVCVLHGLVRPPRAALRELLLGTATLACAAVVVDVALVGYHDAFVTHPATAVANASFLLVAAGLAWLVRALPHEALSTASDRRFGTRPPRTSTA